MRATKYSYSIHENIVAIVDSLEEDTLPLEKAIEDVVAEISDKEKLDSRVYCWLYYKDDAGYWDGYSPCTHTYFDVMYIVDAKVLEELPTREAKIQLELEEAIKVPAIKQKAHFLANNPMIMLEKAYHLNVVADDAGNMREFFKFVPERAETLKAVVMLLGYDYTNRVITKGELFTKASQLAQSANELAYISIHLYSTVLPTAREALRAVEEELGRQASNN